MTIVPTPTITNKKTTDEIAAEVRDLMQRKPYLLERAALIADDTVAELSRSLPGIDPAVIGAVLLRASGHLGTHMLHALADQPQLTDEYGLLIHHLDTTTSEGAIAPTLAEALEVLADFDAKSGPGVLSRTLRVRPVGPWKDAREAGRG